MQLKNVKYGWRSPELKEKYHEAMKNRHDGSPCPLCQLKSVREFKFWRITVDEYPYDMIASKHDMLLPKRHVVSNQLTQEETTELNEIIEGGELDKDYDVIQKSLNSVSSIPSHTHYHLMKIKDISL